MNTTSKVLVATVAKILNMNAAGQLWLGDELVVKYYFGDSDQKTQYASATISTKQNTLGSLEHTRLAALVTETVAIGVSVADGLIQLNIGVDDQSNS